MFPINPARGAGIPAINAADRDPRRTIPANGNILSFLITIGRESSDTLLGRSESIEENDVVDQVAASTASLRFSQADEDGDAVWGSRLATPEAPAVAEHEMEEFGLHESVANGTIVNSGRHDPNGWVLWIYHNEESPHRDTLFTLGGPKYGKGEEPQDPTTGKLICCNEYHAAAAAGEFGWVGTAEEYGYDEDTDVDPDPVATATLATQRAAEEAAAEAAEAVAEIQGAQGGRAPRVNPEQQMVQVALALGDVEETDVTAGGIPVYTFTASYVLNQISFTLDNDMLEAVGASYPPHVSHEPGQVHAGLELALWAAWCWENPTENGYDAYHDLRKGVYARYGRPVYGEQD